MISNHLVHPFLISRSFNVDYRLIVAPGFAWNTKLASTLLDLTGSEDVNEHQQLTYRKLINLNDSSEYTLIFRVFPAIKKDIGIFVDENLQDSFGRTILHVEGVILENSIEAAELCIPFREFIDKIHKEVIGFYEEFWQGVCEKAISQPLSFSLTEMTDNSVSSNLASIKTLPNYVVSASKLPVDYRGDRNNFKISSKLVIFILIIIITVPMLNMLFLNLFALRNFLHDKKYNSAYDEIWRIVTKLGDSDRNNTLSVEEVNRLKCKHLKKIHKVNDHFNFEFSVYLKEDLSKGSPSEKRLTEALLTRYNECQVNR